MAENTKIEWCHHTFNPWRGCTKISPGCTNCYADTLSARNPKTLGVWGPKGTRVVASESMWREPVKWNKVAACDCFAEPKYREKHLLSCPQSNRPRVFCASLADVFEDWDGAMSAPNGVQMWKRDDRSWTTSDHYRDTRMLTMQDVRNRIFALIDATPNLDWLVLTKRPENIARLMPPLVTQYIPEAGEMSYREGIRDNLWLGTSVENQAAADERIPHLLATPAAVRFLSCEPLLGPINLTRLWLPDRSGYWNALDGRLTVKATGVNGNSDFWVTVEKPITGSVGWAIAGGESGPGARPMQIEWARSLVAQCKAAGVPVFVKQVGAFVVDRNDRGFEAENETRAEGPNKGQPSDPKAWPTPVDVLHDLDGTRDGYQGAPVRVVLNDKKGGDMDEWPHDLRVRDFPSEGREEG